MSFKENLGQLSYVMFRTNRARTFWALLLQAVGIVLTLVLLAITSSKPTSSLQWAKFTAEQYESRSINGSAPIIVDSGQSASYNIGLLEVQVCGVTGCAYNDVGSLSPNGSNFINAGRAVITALTFAMLFAIAAICIHTACVLEVAEKLRFPRLLLNISCFLVLCLQIVSVASWYKYGQDAVAGIETPPGSLGVATGVSGAAPGYAVAVNILVVCMTFFAWFFSFWRTCRPNTGEPSAPKSRPAEPVQSSAAPSALETGKKQAAAAPVVEPDTYSNGGSSGGYGQSYGGGNAYSNDTYSSGGSNDSAYSNAGGAYSSKSQSAYGY